MRVPVKIIEPYMSAEYRHGIYLPKSVNEAITESFLTGSEFVDVPNDWQEQTEAAKANDDLREYEYTSVSEHRLAGMEKEQNADNEGAMSEYAVAIILGEQSRFNLFHAYAHAYERIIVCLHKAKKFDKEASYIERYLKYDLSEAVRAKYSTRLEKIKSKIQQ